MSGRVSPATLVPRLLLDTPPGTRLRRVDGTVLLVDISGFTVLSERLAATGRRGTEELIATLSRVFTVLLSATDDGGDVLKFAGDALFVLYTGGEHARRAAHSAWVMQRVLAAIGDIRLASARTRLRMSAGVHTGRFDVVLAGTSTQNAVVVGADTWRVLELQAAAAAGTVLVSAQTARLLPTRLVGPPAAPRAHRLVGGGVVTTDTLQALHGVEREHAERFAPRAFVERSDLLGSAPDHRWAAMGFVAVSGVPGEIDDDAVARIDELTRIVEDAVDAGGATLLDIDPAPGGFRYFLTAGAPRGVEDPEGSLIATLQSIVTAATPYPVHAGAASGRVFAGFVGTSARQTYTTMGDATNLAARLTSHAPEGAVLVSEQAAAHARLQVGLRARDAVRVKGKAKPVGVGVVAGIGPRVGAAAVSLPFFGRTAETGAVVAADALIVSGPPGIGKTALVAHALGDRPALHIAGDRYAARAAYGTLRRLLRPLLDIPDDADPAAAGQLLTSRLRRLAPELLPWGALVADLVGARVPPSAAVRALDDEFRTERTHAVLAELLPAILAEGATVVVEDAQWVDAASAAALAATLPTAEHALLVARRETDGGLTGSVPQLPLDGLDDDAAAELVEAVAGHALLPADLAAVLERGAGNPLYLIELAAVSRTGDEPRALEQLIGERIDALSDDSRHLVREAAVLGARVPRALFERCLGGADDLPADFLVADDETVAFRSDLFREVAYEQLSFQARRHRHREAAAAIESDPAIAGGAADAMLAVHYEAVADWPAAAAAARRSAETAERAYALEVAVQAYRAAAGAARRARADASTLRELWESLGRVCLGCGRTAEAYDAYDEARRLARDAVARARIDRQRAYTLNLLGRPAEATVALRRARRNAKAAGEAGITLDATILVTETGMLLRQARWRDMQRVADSAIGLLEGRAQSREEKSALADAYRYHDIAASELHGDAAMVHLQRALALCEEIGDAKAKSKVLSLIGIREYRRGAWSAAVGVYARAQDASEAAGDTVGAAVDSANTAEILIDQGEVDAARPLLRRARRVFAAVDDTYLVAYITSFAARADLRAGDAVAAIAGFEAATEVFDALDEVESALDARVRRVGALLQLREVAAARDEIVALGAMSDLSGVTLSQLRRHAARIAELDADLPHAAELLRSATDAAGAALYERALCLGALARVTGAEGVLCRAEAETILRGLGVVDIPRLLDPAPVPDRSAASDPPREPGILR